MGFLLFIIFIAAFVTIVIFSLLASQKRRKDMIVLAADLGLKFFRVDPYRLPRKHGDMRAFSTPGRSRKAYNTMSGEVDGLSVIITDYRYTISSGRNSQTIHSTYCLVYTGKALGSINVRPENFFDKISAWVGFDDINFESKEFNDAYFVRSDDKKFAYDVIHPEMMEYLLRVGGLHFEIAGEVILAHYNKRLPVKDMARLLRDARGIYDRLPSYL